MSDGTNDTWRVWSALQRKEDELGGAGGYLAVGWGLEQIGRVNRVRRALEESGPIARRLITRQLAGIDLSSIWPILVAACQDIALYYGGSVVVGGAMGGIGGALLGGVGAVPGAAAGAAAGSYVGGAVLALLGLKSLVEDLAEAIPEALRCYEDGFLKAWGPVRRDSSAGIDAYGRGDPAFAAHDMAQGHVIMITMMLGAMIAYLTRGRGDRAVLLNEIGRSRRLGPRVAKWLEENQERLQRHPALQSRRHGALPHEDAAAPQKPGRKPGQEREPSRPKGMPQKKVPCFTTEGLPQGSMPEFDRQLAGQETGINNMTVDEYIKGREAFDSGSSVRNPSIARRARTNYKKELTADIYDTLRSEGMSRSKAVAKSAAMAAGTMKTLAALHNPDMVVGGKDAISSFGDRNINSRIGSQWKQHQRLIELDKAASAVPEALRPRMKMNAKLERCK